MIFFALCYALLFVGAGFIAGRYPTMISGISTMSAEKRKNIDLPAIGALYKKGLIAIGVVSTISNVLFTLLAFHAVAIISLIAVTLIGVFIIMLLAQRYDRNPKSRFAQAVPFVVCVVLMLLVSISVCDGVKPTEVIVTGSEVVFLGKYGVAIERDNIAKVELWEHIPRIKVRTNGMGLGSINKGLFRLDSIGQCRLFVNLPNPPFLYIELGDSKKIIFNSEEEGYAESLYNAIIEYEK